MIEEIEKCKIALKHALDKAKSLREISEINIPEFTVFMNSIPQDLHSAPLYAMRQKIMHYQYYPEKLSEEIKPLIDLLNQTVSELYTIISSKTDNRFGDRLGAPNIDFVKLIQEKKIDENTEIFYVLEDGEKVTARIIKEGYLKLDSNGKLFSSPTTASSFVCGKSRANGWKYWFAIDSNGESRSLEYYKTKSLALSV